jgi:hypothetical protein
MSLHLQKFVDRVRGLEARGGRDLVMSITEAKDLHADIYPFVDRFTAIT